MHEQGFQTVHLHYKKGLYMFDNFLIRPDSLKNDYEKGEAVGFQFAVKIADYRGCFLSLHNGYYIECDGNKYKRDVQSFEVNDKGPRSFDILKKCVWEHWDFGREAIVHVKEAGGLAPGRHKIRLQQVILMQYGYAPWDEEWVEHPPLPGDSSGIGKSSFIFEYDLELNDGGQADD